MKPVFSKLEMSRGDSETMASIQIPLRIKRLKLLSDVNKAARTQTGSPVSKTSIIKLTDRRMSRPDKSSFKDIRDDRSSDIW